MGRCIRQRSRVHSGALLLIPADCSHESTALECKPALKHRLGHLANVIANGCAGTDPFWHDTKESGRATGGQSNQLRSINPHHSTLLVSRAQTPAFIPTGNCTVWVQGISVRIELGLLGVLCQQALRVAASVGDGRRTANFCGFPETRSFLLAFCPPPWYWDIVRPLEQILSLQMSVNIVG